MAGRKFFLHLFRPATRRVVLMVCAAAVLTAGSALGLHHAAAQKALRAVFSTAPASEINASSGMAVTASAAEGPSALRGTALGGFDGSFDNSTGEIKITPQSAARGGRFSVQARSDANTPLPAGSFTFRLTDTNGSAPDRVFISSLGVVSFETEILNNTASTFYNLRVVFTAFRVSNAGGAAASNSPTTGGLAYYNDGQVAWNNQLGVSRNYGDVAGGGSGKAVWTFAVPTSGPTFYFSAVVLADLGVAAESVEPAAVQVNGSADSSVIINGRGFVPTPTVQLLNGSGGVVNPGLQVNSISPTQINVTIPRSTAPGIYGLRVINPGGTAGSFGSSAILSRLTVTGEPTPANTISGLINGLSGTGPYLVSGNLVIGSDVVVQRGTVFYFANGATLQIASSGNLIADGGIPGVPSTSPGQIVFTAQRTPGQGIPTQGAWGGIDATSTSSGQTVMRNCVVEYGGLAGGAQIKTAGSGRRLRFTDSVCRRSAGSGIDASGTGDLLEGFARSRVDNNGSGAGDVAILLSGNSSLGLYDLDGTTNGTSVGDANYYYSSANSFNGNTNNIVQIGTDASAASNDFTRSGVLVGQGDIPIHLRGSSSNPAIVGRQPTAQDSSLAELSINPAALIKLAPGMDFQAGDLAQNLRGGISANGLAGVTQVPGAAFGSSKYITFDKIGGGNWGAIYFSRNAPASSILNFVSVQNGGASSLGNAAVLAEGATVIVTNSEIMNSSTGSVLAYAGGNIITGGATFGSTNVPLIDTIAGGLLGDGNPAAQAQLAQPTAIASDPSGRGVYVADYTSNPSVSYIRFINTTTAPVVIAGQRIVPGTIQTVAGRESGDLADNVPGLTADLGLIEGLAVSTDGKLVYFTDTADIAVRVLNVSSQTITVAGISVAPGNVSTLADSSVGFSASTPTISDLAVTKDGDVLVVDSNSGTNKVFKIAVAGRTSPGQAVTVVAGRDKGAGETNNANNPAFVAGPATNVLMFQPRAIEADAAGNFYVTDTGHGRVVKVDTGGNASLVAQFTSGSSGPYPTSLTLFGGNLFVANGNQQVVIRLTGGSPAIVAGTGTLNSSGGTLTGSGTFCDYSSTSCGDGGTATAAGFYFPGTNLSTGITADSKGIYILDQAVVTRGRVRFLNLSGSAVSLAGVTVADNAVNTIAGTGLPAPYDNGLATSATLNVPTGVAIDASNNVWFTDTASDRLRFFNRGTSPVTLFAGTTAEKIVPPGVVVVINSDGSGSGDGVPANQAVFSRPQGIAITTQGIYIADSTRGPTVPPGLNNNGRKTGLVRFINTSASTVKFYAGTALEISVPPGFATTVAGGGTALDDLNSANTNMNNAVLVDPTDVAVDASFIYIADAGNGTVRKVNRATGNILSLTGTSVPAAQRLSTASYSGLGFDSTGRLYIVASAKPTTTNTFQIENQVLRESSAGSGTFSVMNAGALTKPKDLVVDTAGNAYVTNAGTSQILKIGANGAVTAVAGLSTTPPSGSTFFYNFGGDRGSALAALLNINPDDFNVKVDGQAQKAPQTVGIAISAAGEIIFTDAGNNRIRRIR